VSIPPPEDRRGWTPKQLGLVVLFASLSMLFGASLVGYLITRAQNDVWRTADMPRLPLGLVASSALLIGVSFSIDRAARAVRHNNFEGLVRYLRLTGLFAVGFVVGQLFNWQHMAAAVTAPQQTLYPFTFYTLTGLHALHVIGGLIPLGIVMRKAQQREYSSSHDEGVRLLGQYWHYLGVVWIVLLGVLYFGS
jgi:cytochrome c oxidase subunit 3